MAPVDKTTKTLAINRDDDLVKATMLTDGGKVVHPALSRRRSPVEPAQSRPMVLPKPQRREETGRIQVALVEVERHCVMDQTLQKTLDQLDQATAAVRLAVQNMANAPGGAEAAGDAAHALSGGAIDPFVFRFAIFVLAIFVGYYVVWSVTPALHTPLMAVTNAISSVIVVGALLAVGIAASGIAAGFGFVALMLVSVNIFGGFLVTQRMLAMYKKKDK